MVFICLVCEKPADFIVDIPSSKAVRGRYKITRRGYCKAHKPDIWSVEEFFRIRDDTNESP